MNQVNLCGYLGKDFEMKITSSGSAFSKTTLAVSENRKNEKGEYEIYTSWIPIVLFGCKAEVANQYMKKGDHFLGTGKIVTSSYTDQYGNTRYGWQVVVSFFKFIEKKQNKIKIIKLNQNQIKLHHQKK